MMNSFGWEQTRMSLVNEETRQYLDEWGQRIERQVEERMDQVTTEVFQRVAKELTSVAAVVNELAGKLSTGFESLGEFRGETKATLKALIKSIETVGRNLDGVISRQQRQGSAVANMQQNCSERHKHDTDEQAAVNTLTAKVEHLEDSQVHVTKKLTNGDAKFNELENTDVRMLTVQATKLKDRDLFWRRVVQITAILSSLGAGTLITLFIQHLAK